ncbi:MAG: class IV adenylate cyclase [Candidatus Odinarchaeota archaeon]
MLEIELKIELNKRSEEKLRKFIASRGVKGREAREDDYYLDRNFELARGDKALRIRLAEINSEKMIELTYKGAKLSNKIKSRHEITIKLEERNIDAVLHLFEQLGYDLVGVVKKTRTYWDIEKDGWKFLVSLDRVEDLGTFMEIETLRDMEEKEEAERKVHELLDLMTGEEAGKSKSILQSYLELVLAKRGHLPDF